MSVRSTGSAAGRKRDLSGRIGAYTDSVLEAIGLAAFFTAQVDEVMCHSGRVLMGHFPGDPERVTAHLADLNIMGCGEQLHFSHHLQYKKMTNCEWG